jgi:hypothetical protein
MNAKSNQESIERYLNLIAPEDVLESLTDDRGVLSRIQKSTRPDPR